MRCYEEGTLRAYADRALPASERRAVQAHLITCPLCQEQLDAIQARAGRVAALLAAPVPDTSAALARFRAGESGDINPLSRSKSMQSTNSVSRFRRPFVAGISAVVMLVALLAFPPVRAAAGQLLQIFRVQSVVLMPVTQERMQELRDLDINGSQLFLGDPQVSNKSEPKDVADAAAAAQASGGPVAEPSNLPGTVESATYKVSDSRDVSAQVDVTTARQALDALGITDVTLPDALGSQPITAKVPAMVMSEYTGSDFSVELMQGAVPTVNLPDGVELRDLGRAWLRVLGTAPAQADALSKQIDWSSTLVAPVPATVRDLRQISINGAQGMMMSQQQRSERVLYWQRDGRFYVLHSTGLSEEELVAAAESVR